MTIFHHPFIDIEKLSIVTLHTRGTKAKGNLLSSYKQLNVWIQKENMRKNGVPKVVKLTPSRNMSKQKQNAERGTQNKKNEEEKKWIEINPEEKMGWNENEEKQGRKTKVELVPHAIKKMILGLIYYPETQFGPTYHFFRNPEPRPTLRAVKVHFDWTWIPRLKRFSLKNFHPKASW